MLCLTEILASEISAILGILSSMSMLMTGWSGIKYSSLLTLSINSQSRKAKLQIHLGQFILTTLFTLKGVDVLFQTLILLWNLSIIKIPCYQNFRPIGLKISGGRRNWGLFFLIFSLKLIKKISFKTIPWRTQMPKISMMRHSTNGNLTPLCNFRLSKWLVPRG